MSGFYSQRNAPPPSQLRYDVPSNLRDRVLAILNHHIRDARNMRLFLSEMEDLLCRQYGALREVGYDVLKHDEPVVEHFLYCSDEQALDFIEACFRLRVQCGGQGAVDEINAAFRQEGVGYELTKFLGKATPRGAVVIGGKPPPPDQLPRIIRVDNQAAHAQMVGPALSLLTNPVLAVANAEMLKAFSDHRAGRHEDAITACGSAFESVLKTICDAKGWKYDPDKDTCATLVDICYQERLFTSLYVELFKRIGTVRNKLGDAHGRGPTPLHTVEPAHAEHILHMACSHVILLCRLAGLH